MRHEKAELEGKTSPSVSNRAAPPAIGLGSGMLFPQLTPSVREGKPLPGSQAHDQYINGGGYSDASQNAKRGRQEDPYTSSRGISSLPLGLALMLGPYPPNSSSSSNNNGGQPPKRPKVSTPGPSSQPSAAEPIVPAPAASTMFSLVDQDIDSTPANYKRQGDDWFAIFNKNIPRALDVSILHTFEHPSVVCCVRFSADGKYIATGCNKSAQIYDVKTGGKVVTLVDENAEREGDLYIRSVCFSPDGRYLATGAEDKIIRIWDIQRKKIKNQFIGHEQDIYSLDFSRDGNRLASGSGDRTARLWDMETGQNLLTLSIEDGVTTVAVSPDGKYLAAGSLDRAVRVWDTEKGTLVERLEGHKDSVYSVAFSPNGMELLSGSLDKTIKLWELTAPRVAGMMQSATPRVGICKTTFVGHKDFVLSVALSPDGKWVVSGSKDRGVQFWNPVDGQPQFMLQGHKNSGIYLKYRLLLTVVISVALSPLQAGKLFATGSGDCRARIWSYELKQ